MHWIVSLALAHLLVLSALTCEAHVLLTYIFRFLRFETKGNICGPGTDNIIGDEAGVVELDWLGIKRKQTCLRWQQTKLLSEEWCVANIMDYTVEVCKCKRKDGTLLMTAAPTASPVLPLPGTIAVLGRPGLNRTVANETSTEDGTNTTGLDNADASLSDVDAIVSDGIENGKKMSTGLLVGLVIIGLLALLVLLSCVKILCCIRK
jgi:hypothetical protein